MDRIEDIPTKTRPAEYNAQGPLDLIETLRLKARSPERVADPEVGLLMQKAVVRERPGCIARFPVESPKIRIRLTSGEVLVRAGAFPRGHRRNQISDAELDVKFDGLVAGRSSRDRDACRSVRERLRSAWELPTIDEVIRPLGSLEVHDTGPLPRAPERGSRAVWADLASPRPGPAFPTRHTIVRASCSAGTA